MLFKRLNGKCQIKEATKQGPANVWHNDLWGIRKMKYEWLNDHVLDTTKWAEVIPNKPFYLFKLEDDKIRSNWDEMISAPEVLREYSLGIVTKRDNLVVGFTNEEVEDNLKHFFDPSKTHKEAVEYFGLKLQDKDKWNAKSVREATKGLAELAPYLRRELYRPFDKRSLLYHERLVARPNKRVMGNLSDNQNFGLVLGRQGQAVSSLFWNLITVTDTLSDQNIFRRGGGSVFPIYIYPEKQSLFSDDGGDWDSGKDGRVPNFDKGFVDEFSGKIGLKFVSDGKGDLKKTFGPEDLFGYIYAVFHSPGYRKRYAEFLKIDFPRVPMVSDKKLFCELSVAGNELVELHLMESEQLEDTGRYPAFNVSGSNEVDSGHPKFMIADGAETGAVYINKEQFFGGVERDVWEFCVGGYQVCEKWLKDRQGRVLSFDDIEHYQKIVVALGETINGMARIDEIIDEHGGWPI